MVYIALLRGINVGGNSKVEMKRLKLTFEKLGLSNVKTYINSGNVVFSDDRNEGELQSLIEKELEHEFGFAIKTLVVSQDKLNAIYKEIPDDWLNNGEMKCDVMFLWESQNNQEILSQLKIKPEVDRVKYVDGAILWCIDRVNANKSGMYKLIGTEVYKQMTIRNCNTVRKLYALASDVSSV